MDAQRLLSGHEQVVAVSVEAYVGDLVAVSESALDIDRLELLAHVLQAHCRTTCGVMKRGDVVTLVREHNLLQCLAIGGCVDRLDQHLTPDVPDVHATILMTSRHQNTIWVEFDACDVFRGYLLQNAVRLHVNKQPRILTCNDHVLTQRLEIKVERILQLDELFVRLGTVKVRNCQQIILQYANANILPRHKLGLHDCLIAVIEDHGAVLRLVSLFVEVGDAQLSLTISVANDHEPVALVVDVGLDHSLVVEGLQHTHCLLNILKFGCYV